MSFWLESSLPRFPTKIKTTPMIKPRFRIFLYGPMYSLYDDAFSFGDAQSYDTQLKIRNIIPKPMTIPPKTENTVKKDAMFSIAITRYNRKNTPIFKSPLFD